MMDDDVVDDEQLSTSERLMLKVAPFLGYIIYSIPFVIVIVFRVGTAIFQPAVVLFMYDAVCLNNYPDDAVDALNNNSRSMADSITCSNLTVHAQNVVQKEATNYLVALKFIQGVITFFMCLYCGGWMDRIGRRLPMMLSCLGGIGMMIVFALIQITHGPVIEEILIAMAFYSIVGPSTLIPAAIESYLTSKTEASERTRQLGLSVASNLVGLVGGSLILGGMADELPFWAMFLCVALFYAAAYALSAYVMPENPNETLNSFGWNMMGLGPDPDDSCDNVSTERLVISTEKKSLFQKASSFYHLENLKSTFDTLMCRRENNMRRYIWATLICVVLKQLSEIDMLLFFVRHAPLNFSKSQYGYLLSFEFAMSGLQLIFLLPILQNRLKLSDSIVVAGCGIFKTFGLVLLGFSEQTWMVYIASFFNAVFGIITACLRSIISKMVEPEEAGRCFNIIASVEVISDLAGVIISSRLYYLGLSLEDNRYGRSIPFCVMAFWHLILTGLALYIYFGVKSASAPVISFSYKALDSKVSSEEGGQVATPKVSFDLRPLSAIDEEEEESNEVSSDFRPDKN